MVVSVRSLLFDKGEYIMKLSQKKWKSLISGVLLAASASSFLIAPVYAADYSKPLIGTLKKDSEILSPDGNTVTENDGKLIYDFQGKDHTFTITNKDGITARKDSVYNNVGADGSYGTLHIYQTNNKSNVWAGVNGFTANKGIIVVNSNLDITATSEYSSVGIAAANKGNLIINGNVKMRKDDAENPWGIITKNVHGNIGPGGATSMGGDANADNAGQIYQKDSNNLTIDTLSGSIRVIYDHEFEDAETRAAGDKKIVYKAGNTVINNAKDGSQVIMATGSNGINTFDKDSVEDAFKGLANKLIYKDAEKNPGNLKAELQLGGGLTGSNVSWSGQIEWDGNNGSYKLDSAEQSIKLLYDEDAVSKDTRAAIMSGMVGWRNAATDTYRARVGAYGEDNQGVWARTWGGQNKYTGNNTSFKNSYWAGQVGYDKTLANGWNVGVAFDYMTGDDSYYAGSGDTKTYTLGLYGSKEISNNEFIDLTAKVGRVSNDFETKDILGRTVKGDYKANGFSFSGQYSKRFGSEAAGYFEPQAQLTIGRLGSCDFDSTGTLEGHISQDAFTSIVGRLGIEAGQASEHGRYFARLSLSHEFAGDVDTHFSDSSATMTREFNLDGTWCDLTVGGTYDLSDKVSFYGDVTKTLTGDYKQDWKVNAGLRFTF